MTSNRPSSSSTNARNRPAPLLATRASQSRHAPGKTNSSTTASSSRFRLLSASNSVPAVALRAGNIERFTEILGPREISMATGCGVVMGRMPPNATDVNKSRESVIRLRFYSTTGKTSPSLHPTSSHFVSGSTSAYRSSRFRSIEMSLGGEPSGSRSTAYRRDLHGELGHLTAVTPISSRA